MYKKKERLPILQAGCGLDFVDGSLVFIYLTIFYVKLNSAINVWGFQALSGS